jgi:hypothetical protein
MVEQSLLEQALGEVLKCLNHLKNPSETSLATMILITYLYPFTKYSLETALLLGNAILVAHHFAPLALTSIPEGEFKKALYLFFEQNDLSYFKKLYLQDVLASYEDFNNTPK